MMAMSKTTGSSVTLRRRRKRWRGETKGGLKGERREGGENKFQGVKERWGGGGEKKRINFNKIVNL